jgi:hypothetical protein
MVKNLLLTIFCLIPLLAFSQKKSIDGFLDIPFGSDSATVKTALTAKGGIKNDTFSHKDFLVFNGLTLSGRKVFVLKVSFVDNKAYQADFIFNDYSESDVLQYYVNLSTDIEAVYGKGDITYDFGDSNNTTRIRRLKSGNASCKTIWQTKNKNTILLTFLPVDNTLLDIELLYRSSSLWDIYAAKKRSDL